MIFRRKNEKKLFQFAHFVWRRLGFLKVVANMKHTKKEKNAEKKLVK